MIEPWKKIETRPRGEFKVFSVRQERKISPRTGHDHDFYVLDCANWVNVIALTPARQLVLVEQFRHGSESVELEIPGGVMDHGEMDPVATAVRELREETGFEGRNAQLIGTVRPNPAIMSNYCHTVLIEDCALVHAVELDEGEDIATRLLPLDEAIRLAAVGGIRHSLVVAGLFFFDQWRAKNSSTARLNASGSSSCSP
jgi:8-oxo-dGTP pyrophosphatase MutT (NUDIX family)